MEPSTRLKALLLIVLLFGIPFWVTMSGLTLVIVDGDGPAPVGVGFFDGRSERSLWRLTGHAWLGRPDGSGDVRVTCRGAGGALQREEFGYVGPGMPQTIHVAPCPGEL